MRDLPAHPFWDFSLNVYSRPGVADALLALQDDLDADVNVMLYACYAADCGVDLSIADINTLDAAAKAWRDQVVVPLRRMRRLLKSGVGAVARDQADTVRKRVAQSEIQAEHVEQLVLANAVPVAQPAAPDPQHSAQRATANLERYFASFAMILNDRATANLRHITAAL